LGFFGAGADDDDERARLAGVGGTVIDDERGRERRVGVGSFVERVIGKEPIDRAKNLGRQETDFGARRPNF